MSLTFVRVVKTIVVTVTDVNSRNAIAVVAGEKVTETGSVFGLASVFRFVLATLTIRVAVTIPSGGNAPMIGAPEGVRGAGPGTAMKLILVGVIPAIVIPVA